MQAQAIQSAKEDHTEPRICTCGGQFMIGYVTKTYSVPSVNPDDYHVTKVERRVMVMRCELCAQYLEETPLDV